MKDADKLFVIKLVHTLAWAFFVSAILYTLYSGVTGTINKLTWIAIFFTIGEGLVLLAFKWNCPLTLIARKYSNSNKDNFDIFLPNWLARHNKFIFTSIFILALTLVLIQTF